MGISLIVLGDILILDNVYVLLGVSTHHFLCWRDIGLLLYRATVEGLERRKKGILSGFCVTQSLHANSTIFYAVCPASLPVSIHKRDHSQNPEFVIVILSLYVTSI